MGDHPKIFLGIISFLLLTTNLLQAASRANQASSQQQKDVITKQMVEVAKERKVAALKQMEEKPEEFLRIALPEKITSTLPPEVQQEVEFLIIC